jgi:hypothetical protein
MESPKQEQALVSLVELKKLARTKLPPSIVLRDLILSEPDLLNIFSTNSSLASQFMEN